MTYVQALVQTLRTVKLFFKGPRGPSHEGHSDKRHAGRAERDPNCLNFHPFPSFSTLLPRITDITEEKGEEEYDQFTSACTFSVDLIHETGNRGFGTVNLAQFGRRWMMILPANETEGLYEQCCTQS